MPGNEFIDDLVADTENKILRPSLDRIKDLLVSGEALREQYKLAYALAVADVRRLTKALDKAQRVIHSDICGSVCRSACMEAKRLLVTAGEP